MEKEIVQTSIVKMVEEEFSLMETDCTQLSPLTLAYIGDGFYDLLIRTYLVESSHAPVNKLHKRKTEIVKATAQSKMIQALEPLLTEEELTIYKRGRNAKSVSTAKNATVTDYRKATGLEALFGYLYLKNRISRSLELVKAGLAFINESDH